MGVPAYRAVIKVGGSPTEMSSAHDLEMTEETDKGNFVYELPPSDRYKSLWDRRESINLELTTDDTRTDDDSVKIVAVNYLFGRVILSEELNTGDYTDESVSVQAYYIPIAGADETDEEDESLDDQRVAFCQSYNLNLEATEHDFTGFKEAQDNDGAYIRGMGMIDSDVSLSGFYGMPSEVRDSLMDREPVIVEIIPGGGDENGEPRFRGWYVLPTEERSGAVDDAETTDVSLMLDEGETQEGRLTSMSWSDIYLD